MTKVTSALLSLYSPRYPGTLVYMLQATGYQPGPYLAWFWRTNNFKTVARRRQLDRTKAAKLLLLALYSGILLQIAGGAVLIVLGHWEFGVAALLAYPIVWAHAVVLPLAAGRLFIAKPQEKRLVRRSKKTFKSHAALKIAVAGSYGKTSMKELLLAVLGAGTKVAATPANKNVAISHARWARLLSGDEDILIIEYGEGKPGDVKRFAETTKPNLAIITGLAPAHLDQYKSLAAAAEDIFSVAEGLGADEVFVNADSQRARPYVKNYETYSAAGALGWKVKDVKLSLEGTDFKLQKGQREIKVHSALLGRHQIGPLVMAIALADKLGLSAEQIQQGIAAVKAYEHRMDPRPLHGAWLIDDTYNGNIEGVQAGLALLKELPAKRKLYVTPGLVEQGPETEAVHLEIGRLIAAAEPDEVVLMRNSVTKYIEQGLKARQFANKLTIVDDPLNFYQNLEHYVAAGDLVLMQNDWPDNYI